MRCEAVGPILSFCLATMTFEMLIYIVIAATLAVVVDATTHSQHNGTDNLTVKTRTGTFIGDLNDTYTDVRQFKWIPYAKVSIPLTVTPHSL
jgi:hypothetical protein